MHYVGRTIITAISTFAVGVAVGVMVSPNSGPENRRMIARKMKEQQKKFEDQIEELEDRFVQLEKSIVATGTEISEKLKNSTAEAVNQFVSAGPSDEDWSVEGKEVASDLRNMPRK